MRRRDVLAAASTGMTLALAAPSIAQGLRRLTMVTDWPRGPGMLASAERLARTISQLSEGRIEIDVSASGGVVRPLEAFDAVEEGWPAPNRVARRVFEADDASPYLAEQAAGVDERLVGEVEDDDAVEERGSFVHRWRALFR